MKFEKLRIGLLSGLLIISIGINAQNSNVVSAAIEYKKYEPELLQGNLDKAKEIILEAKNFIDPAMKHEDTKNDEKANMYNGKIYFALAELSGRYEDLKEYQTEENMEMIKTSFKKAMESRKYSREVETFVKRKSNQAANMSSMAFQSKKFDIAYVGFISAYELEQMIGETDEDMKQNALYAGLNYLDTLKKQGENEKIVEFVKVARENFPKNTSFAIEGVNAALATGDMTQAEKFFAAAAKADPENKALFSSMGSIYLASADEGFMELQEMDITDSNYPANAEEVESLYAKAEGNLERAIEIDGTYLDALYNLGVLYLGRGQKLEQKAKQMDYNDPSYNDVISKSEEMYKKAINPLEKYIEAEPDNAAVLQVLFQVHRRAGNSEKAIEYKKRFEAAQSE